MNLEFKLYTAKLLVSQPSFNKVGIIIGKFMCYKSLGINLIPAELIQAGNRALL
jgi:hypothetical protein